MFIIVKEIISTFLEYSSRTIKFLYTKILVISTPGD